MNFNGAHLKNYLSNHSREALLAVGLVVAGGAAIFFYNDYRKQREQAAQFDFSECFQQYREAEYEKTADWQDVEMSCKAGSNQHSATAMGAYFQAIEAQALAEQGKLEEGIELMSSFISSINSRNPFYNLYRIKYALMQVSSSEESVRNEGKELLKALAHDESNKQQDEALYYLGHILADEGKAEEAQAAWHKLVQQFGLDDAAKSPWAELAKEKISA